MIADQFGVQLTPEYGVIAHIHVELLDDLAFADGERVQRLNVALVYFGDEDLQLDGRVDGECLLEDGGECFDGTLVFDFVLDVDGPDEHVATLEDVLVGLVLGLLRDERARHVLDHQVLEGQVLFGLRVDLVVLRQDVRVLGGQLLEDYFD